MLAELQALTVARAVPVDVVDVDSDAQARVRYGHKIPVLLYAGEEVHKALAHHRRPV